MKVWIIVLVVLLAASVVFNVSSVSNYNSLNQRYANLEREYASLQKANQELEDMIYGIGYDLNNVLEGIPGYTPDRSFSTLNEALSGIDRNLDFVAEIVEDMVQFTAAWNELKNENERLKATLIQIQREAEKAQKTGFWENLIAILFSILVK